MRRLCSHKLCPVRWHFVDGFYLRVLFVLFGGILPTDFTSVVLFVLFGGIFADGFPFPRTP